jgi:hypothetical protein
LRILEEVKKAKPQPLVQHQRQAEIWEALRFLLDFPADPRQVSLVAAEQLLGLRPRPPVQYLVVRPRPQWARSGWT